MEVAISDWSRADADCVDDIFEVQQSAGMIYHLKMNPVDFSGFTKHLMVNYDEFSFTSGTWRGIRLIQDESMSEQ